MMLQSVRKLLTSNATAVKGSLARQLSASANAGTFLENFGSDRFDDHAMAATVDADTLSAFKAARESGAVLEKQHANKLAGAMAKWAQSKGAVQYAHWFSPVRGANGLKHDGFLDYGACVAVVCLA